MVWSVREYEAAGGDQADVIAALMELKANPHDPERLAMLRACCQSVVMMCEMEMIDMAQHALHQTLLAQALQPELLAIPGVRDKFQRWLASVGQRATPGPLRHIEGTYRSEPLSGGRVGKEIGPHVYGDWKQSGSDAAFAGWLDSDDGRQALLARTIMNPDLRALHVQYLSPAALPLYQLHFRAGLVFRGSSADGFHPQDHGHTEAIFVLDLQNNFYAGFHDTGRFHHSSFLCGGPVKGAGKMWLEHGVIKRINSHSGHYGPVKGHLLNVLRALLVKLNDGPKATLRGKSAAEIKAAYLAGNAASQRGQALLAQIEVQHPLSGPWIGAVTMLASDDAEAHKTPLYP